MNHTTGHFCDLAFKEAGFFSSIKNEVVGSIHDSTGTKLVSLSGRWDESICKFSDSTPNNLEVIWRARLVPPNHTEMYGFTQFALELNEFTRDLEGLLPPTDTRYRPDQRLYEEGKLNDAEAEKQRLEQKQRERRKQRELDGETWIPQWFERRTLDTGEESWQYKEGSYWETRNLRGSFPQLDLFGP
ncbi:hypothetical protein HK096_009725 [Nowakowskiella sp. JEL0078]|nr:hypothetical protein HK096_009725 [Nowakowskiella sp. JEL0078]